MSLVGYSRISTAAQDLALQRDALEEAGCEKIFEDTTSGASSKRPGLSEALSYLRPGDVLVIWRLDRLGRTLKDLLALAHDLEERGVGFRSLMEQLDTTSAGGNLVFQVFGAIAEFERNLIRERTAAGLRAAKARGRPRLLSDKDIAAAKVMLLDEDLTVADIAARLGTSKATLYRALPAGGRSSLPERSTG